MSRRTSNAVGDAQLVFCPGCGERGVCVCAMTGLLAGHVSGADEAHDVARIRADLGLYPCHHREGCTCGSESQHIAVSTSTDQEVIE